MKNIENTSPENLIIFELTRNCIEEKQNPLLGAQPADKPDLKCGVL